MIIRKFKKSDAKEVSILKIRSQREVLKCCYPKKVIDFFCERNTPEHIAKQADDRDLFVAVEKGKIVGINGIKGRAIRSFYVLPGLLGKGIGRKLMAHAEKFARKNGIKKLLVHSSLYAEGFYRKCGFRKLRALRTKLGNLKFDEILMEKKL